MWARPNADILEGTFRPGRGLAPATLQSRSTAIRSALARFERRHGFELALLAVVADPDVAARLIASDEKLSGEGRVQKATIRNLRHALNSLIAMAPPPPGCTRDELRLNLKRAWIATCQARGLRYVTGPGSRHVPKVRRVPSPTEVGIVANAMRAMVLPLADACADLLAFTFLTGVRIGAAISATRDDLKATPDNRLWVFVHEKSRPDRRPVRAASESPITVAGWLTLPPGASLWSDGGRVVTKAMFGYRLTKACTLVGMPRFVPHDLRRGFAVHVRAALGIEGVMRAGGWTAEAVLEEYLRHRAPPLLR